MFHILTTPSASSLLGGCHLDALLHHRPEKSLRLSQVPDPLLLGSHLFMEHISSNFLEKVHRRNIPFETLCLRTSTLPSHLNFNFHVWGILNGKIVPSRIFKTLFYHLPASNVALKKVKCHLEFLILSV